MDSFHLSAILRCISTNTTWSLRVELVVVENRNKDRFTFSTWVLHVIVSGRVPLPPQVCLFIHWLVKLIHAPVCLCVTACHIWFILSNVKHHVFLLRSKVNKKERSMVWPQRTWALAFPLELAEIWTHAPFVQIKWGTGEANVTFPLFILYCFVSIYISSDGSVIFTVLFGTLLNLMYCMVVFLHVYWIYRWAGARAFKAHNKTSLLFFILFFLVFLDL